MSTTTVRRRPAVLTAALAAISIAVASAQTPIQPPKNSYSPEEDVKLGLQAAAEVRRQLPSLNDEPTEDYVERIGERLIDAIPDNLRQPAFRYSFDVVNLREINAFALPGGPMFLHRGMLEAARSDGEVAGVMAHELSHVILRHGTAQASKAQKFQIGAIAGQILGAIVGGRTGSVIAQGSEFGLGAYFLKYGREYERQADILGAQVMARAGYDPRAMASMFQTIEKQGGNRAPEWLSSHPDPGNRAQAILREAQQLRVERVNASNELPTIKQRLSRMSPAPTMEQVARTQQQGTRGPVGTTGRTAQVEPPSTQFRTYQPANFMRLSVPANWGSIGSGNTVTYAPEGGYVRGSNGESAFTHGLEVGVTRAPDGGSLQQQTDQLLRGFAQANPQLRRRSNYARTNIGGREGLTTTLSNVSEVTGETEAVNLSTVQLRDGSVLFLIGVAPADEARTYFNTFSRVRQSVQLNDR